MAHYSEMFKKIPTQRFHLIIVLIEKVGRKSMENM